MENEVTDEDFMPDVALLTEADWPLLCGCPEAASEDIADIVSGLTHFPAQSSMAESSLDDCFSMSQCRWGQWVRIHD